MTREYCATFRLGDYRTYPEGYEAHARDVVRAKVVRAIMEELAGGGRIVIRLVEERTPAPDGWGGEILSVRAEMTAVQYQNIVMRSGPDLSSLPFGDVALTACGEIVRRLKRAVRWPRRWGK